MTNQASVIAHLQWIRLNHRFYMYTGPDAARAHMSLGDSRGPVTPDAQRQRIHGAFLRNTDSARALRRRGLANTRGSNRPAGPPIRRAGRQERIGARCEAAAGSRLRQEAQLCSVTPCPHNDQIRVLLLGDLGDRVRGSSGWVSTTFSSASIPCSDISRACLLLVCMQVRPLRCHPLLYVNEHQLERCRAWPAPGRSGRTP